MTETTNPKPDRAPDEEPFGEGPLPHEIRARTDKAYYAQVFIEAMPDEEYPRGWWAAKIWNSP
jgi:hypothetical protein